MSKHSTLQSFRVNLFGRKVSGDALIYFSLIAKLMA